MHSIIWIHAMAINDIPDKLARVRTIDQRCVLHGAGVHRYQLNPCLSLAAILRFELEHGVELPCGYREFISKIGDGGAGPYCGVSALSRAVIWAPLGVPFPLARAANPLNDREDGESILNDDEFRAKYYSGCLLISDMGCANWIMLIVTGLQPGQIWFDHNVENGGFEPTGLDFVTWYECWPDQLLGDVGLAERLERQCKQANCRGFPYQCPKCFGTNIRSFPLVNPFETIVLTAWNAPAVSKNTVRSICSDCGYSIDQIS